MLTVTKASVPGLRIEQHKRYRDRLAKQTPLIDENITMAACPDYEGCKCFIQQIKMPFLMTNRSIPVLYYLRENPMDGSIEFISSSRETDAIV